MQAFPLDVLASVPVGASVSSRRNVEVTSAGSTLVCKIQLRYPGRRKCRLFLEINLDQECCQMRPVDKTCSAYAVPIHISHLQCDPTRETMNFFSK